MGNFHMELMCCKVLDQNICICEWMKQANIKNFIYL